MVLCKSVQCLTFYTKTVKSVYKGTTLLSYLDPKSIKSIDSIRAFKIATKERKPNDCFAWFLHVESAKHTFDKLTLCSGCISSIFRLAYICTYFNLFFQVIFFVSITF